MNSKATRQPLPISAVRSRGMMMGWGIVMLAMLGLLSACATTEEQKQDSGGLEAAPPPQEALPSDYVPDSGGEVSLSERTVYFSFDDYSLSAQSQASIDEVSRYMQGNDSVKVKLEGHCDERGTNEYNLALGERRAQSVKNYLVQLGIDESRLSTISYGEERPAAEGGNESAWSQNRRVEFVLD